MAIAKWATPVGRTQITATTVATSLNGLASGTECLGIAYENGANKNLYAAVTVKLGASAAAMSGSITLRVTLNDGTDTADRIGGDLYTSQVLSNALAKVVIFPMVRIYPLSLRFSIVNNTGQAFAGTAGTSTASGNEIYVNPYNEEVA